MQEFVRQEGLRRYMMTRVQFALFAASILCLAGAAADDKPKLENDPASELTKAKAEYQSSVTAAAEKLLAGFAEQQKRLESNTNLKIDQQLKLIEQLKAEKKAFEDGAELPKSAGMKVAVSDYQVRVGAAKRKCEAAFDKAIERHRQNKDLASAKVLLEQKLAFLRPSYIPRDAILWNGSWYWFPSDKATYEEASQIAAQHKGHLATIASEKENDFIAANIQGATFIGLLKTNAGWVNATGERQAYFNWDLVGKQPSSSRGEIYVVIHKNGKWHDYLPSKLQYCVKWK